MVHFGPPCLANEIRLVCWRHLEKPWISSIEINVFIFIPYHVVWRPVCLQCREYPSFNIKMIYSSVLEIVSLWHKLFISPPPPLQHRYFIPDDCVQCPQFLETPYFWNTFYILFVSPLGPWADHERVLFFLITDAIFFYDGSSQSNSDSGSSTSTFLGATLDLCSVLGQNGFSSGTARLFPLCNSNRMINQFLSASLWIWMILVSIFFPPSIYLPYSFCPF